MTRRIVIALTALLALSPLAVLAQETSAPAPTATPTAAPSPTATPTVPELKPAAPLKETGTGAAPTETSTSSAPAGGKGPQDACGGGMSNPWFFFVLMAVMILMYVWMGRSRKKQEQQRKQLLSSLKKGDKITTIGGIIGTVIEVRENEVTVKTDETNNVRMKFARWAIRDVGEPGKEEKNSQGETPEKK